MGLCTPSRKNMKCEPEAATKLIGKGSYGTVYGLIKNGQSIAVKRGTWGRREPEKKTRMMRELYIMKNLQHPNIIPLCDYSLTTRYTELYMPWIETDLDNLLAQPKKLVMEEVAAITFQIVKALEYIHDCGVIHRDIKPSNILINPKDNHVYLCDFNLARQESEDRMTQKVTALWYRAPEVIQYFPYNSRIDVWSAGCVFAELLQKLNTHTNHPLFPGCESSSPANATAAHSFGQNQLGVINQRLATGIEQYLGVIEDRGALDLLHRMLTFTPRLRISAKDAAHHPFFSSRDLRQTVFFKAYIKE